MRLMSWRCGRPELRAAACALKLCPFDYQPTAPMHSMRAHAPCGRRNGATGPFDRGEMPAGAPRHYSFSHYGPIRFPPRAQPPGPGCSEPRAHSHRYGNQRLPERLRLRRSPMDVRHRPIALREEPGAMAEGDQRTHNGRSSVTGGRAPHRLLLVLPGGPSSGVH
jgi:hypothetical protein